MDCTLCSALTSSKTTLILKPGNVFRSRPQLFRGHNNNNLNTKHSPVIRFCGGVKAEASSGEEADNSKKDERKKPNSFICAECDANGAVLCSQCKGSGVNSVDFFNGRFKAGKSCWLCGGRKHVLCGNCNGAGFIGGFMSTFDE